MSDEIFLVPVRERIASLLDKLGQTPGWLAEKAGVERSTVKRILDGQRNPTAETLVALAPVLKVTIEELVQGTDAANRVDGGRKFVDRTDYQEAVRQFVLMEQRATELSRRLREAEESAANEQRRRKQAQEALDAANAELQEAHKHARGYYLDAQRYQEALRQALTELASLKTKAEELRMEVEKLGGQVGSTKALTGIATFCAAAAAALTLSSYLKEEQKPYEDGSRKKKKRAASA